MYAARAAARVTQMASSMLGSVNASDCSGGWYGVPSNMASAGNQATIWASWAGGMNGGRLLGLARAWQQRRICGCGTAEMS